MHNDEVVISGEEDEIVDKVDGKVGDAEVEDGILEQGVDGGEGEGGIEKVG